MTMDHKKQDTNNKQQRTNNQLQTADKKSKRMTTPKMSVK